MSLTTNDKLQCPQCSTPHRADDRFCSSCGHQVSGERSSDAHPVANPETTNKPVKTTKRTRRLKPIGRKVSPGNQTISGVGDETIVATRTARRPKPLRTNGEGHRTEVSTAPVHRSNGESPGRDVSNRAAVSESNGRRSNGVERPPAVQQPRAVENRNASGNGDAPSDDLQAVRVSPNEKPKTDDVALLSGNGVIVPEIVPTVDQNGDSVVADAWGAVSPTATDAIESVADNGAEPTTESGTAKGLNASTPVPNGKRLSPSVEVQIAAETQPSEPPEIEDIEPPSGELDFAKELFDMLESGPQSSTVEPSDHESVVESTTIQEPTGQESEDQRLARMSDVWLVSEAVAAERDAVVSGRTASDVDLEASFPAEDAAAENEPDGGLSLEDFVIAGPESDHPKDVEIGQSKDRHTEPASRETAEPTQAYVAPKSATPIEPDAAQISERPAAVRHPSPARRTLDSSPTRSNGAVTRSAPLASQAAGPAASSHSAEPGGAASRQVSAAAEMPDWVPQPTAPNQSLPMTTPVQAMPMMPSVVHVPVPVQATAPIVGAASTETATEVRPEVPVKLPAVETVGVAESELPDSNEDKGGEVKLESDSQSGLSETQVETLKNSRQRLRAFVKVSRKELFLVQENPSEELPRKIRKLVDELSSAKDLSATCDVIRRLGATKAAAIVSPLQEFVAGSAAASEPMKTAAIRAVSQVSDAASSQFLLSLLTDPVTNVVEETIRALVALRREEALLPLVASALVRSSNRTVLQESLLAEDSSVQLEAVDRLKKLLNDEDEDIVVVALDLVSKIQGDGNFKLFTRLVDHESAAIRASALDALVRTGEKQSVRFLNKAMKDTSPQVRTAAAKGLGQIHSPKSSVLLMGALLDSDVRVRRSCAKSLTQIDDERIPRGVALALKKETDPATIEYLLQGLGQTGSPAAFETLERYLNSGDKEMCHRAMATLRKLRERRSARLVLPFLDNDDADTRRQAAETLGLLGEPKATSRLREILKSDGASEVRASAARALGELGDAASTVALEEALYDDRSVKVQSIISLGRLKAKSSIPAIMAQLRDAGADVRYHACSALGQMEEIPNPERLQEMLEDRDAMVQRGAKAALEKLGVSYRKGQLANRFRRAAAGLVPANVAGGLPVGGTLIALLIIGALGYGGYALFSGGIASLTGPSFRVSDVEHAAISPDGKLVSISRKYRVFETWDLETGQLSHRLETQKNTSGLQFADAKTLVRFVPDGAETLTAFADVKEESFKADGGLKSLSTFLVSTTPDGAYAAFCGFRGEVQIVDMKTRKNKGQAFRIKDFLKNSSIALANNASMLLVGAPNGTMSVYNATNGDPLGQLSLANVLGKQKVSLTSMSLNSDSSLLAAGTRSGEVVIVDLNGNLKVVGVPRKDGSAIVELRFKGKECVFVASDGSLGICDASFQSSSSLKTKLPDRPESVLFSQDGTVALATFDESKEFVVFNVDDDRMMLEVKGDE